MYAQKENSKANNSNIEANKITQKKSGVKQRFELLDKRFDFKAQKNLQSRNSIINNKINLPTRVMQRQLAVDIPAIAAIAATLPLGSTLLNILNEVIAIAGNVGPEQNLPTSGSAVPRFVGGAINDYELRYQYGNLANLVHELTHIAVNTRYGQDFVNYPTPTAVPPVRNIVGSYDLNLAAREIAFMNQNSNDWLLQNLRNLIGWIDFDHNLTVAQKNEVKAKLTYAMTWVHKEYDTVINQILLMLHQWGIPPISPFYQQLEAAAVDAYNRRQGNFLINPVIASPVAVPPLPAPAPSPTTRCNIQ